MRGQIHCAVIDTYSCEIYIPKGKSTEKSPVIYVNGDFELNQVLELGEEAWKEKGFPFYLVNVKSKDWETDYTPWPSPPLNKKGEAMKGGGQNYIRCLTERIKPYVEADYPVSRERKDALLLGYSLAGLTVLYSLYLTDVFGIVGSLSGSLWFDGFRDYVREHAIKNGKTDIYLSLGRKEEKNRNPRMQVVGEATREIYELLKEQQGEERIILEWNEGGHFTDVPGRFLKFFIWLKSCRLF